MIFKLALLRCMLAMTALTATVFAVAQDSYPNKPIHLVVGFAAGGPADGLARIVSQTLGASLGQPIIVENKPGAGGTIAAAQIAKSPPDGYTLFLVSSGHTGNGAFYGNLPYDTVKSFTAIGGVASTPVMILVNAASPYQTLSDFVADARKRPGKLNYGTGGGATLTNLAAEQLKTDANIDAKGIAYKGGGPALTALLGGEIDAVFDTVSGAVGLVRSGKLRALAVTSAKRTPVLPQVPTVAEQVAPQFETTGWYGILAPAGTPNRVVIRFNTELNRALASSSVQDKLATLGASSLEGSPVQFGRLLESETLRWSGLIKRLNLKAE